MQKGLSWLAVALWMALIFFLSHQPGTASGDLSRGVTAIIIDLIQAIAPQLNLETSGFHFFIRKNAHFFAYFMLGLLVMNALRTHRLLGWRRVMATILVCLMYAVSDETHQLFIPGRSGEVRDVMIDTAGSCAAVALYTLVSWLSTQARKKQRRSADSFGG